MVKLEVPVPPRDEQDELVRLFAVVGARGSSEREFAQHVLETKREVANSLLSGAGPEIRR